MTEFQTEQLIKWVETTATTIGLLTNAVETLQKKVEALEKEKVSWASE